MQHNVCRSLDRNSARLSFTQDLPAHVPVEMAIANAFPYLGENVKEPLFI